MQYFLSPYLNEAIKIPLYRNFLFIGFPFIFFGYFIKENEEKIRQIPSLIIIAVIIISLIFMMYESYINIPGYGLDFLATLIFLCPTLFIFILKNSRYKTSDGYIGTLASGVYYTHLFAIILAGNLFYKNDLYIYVLPTIIFFSFLISATVIQLNKRIRIFL